MNLYLGTSEFNVSVVAGESGEGPGRPGFVQRMLLFGGKSSFHGIISCVVVVVSWNRWQMRKLGKDILQSNETINKPKNT